MNFWRFFFEPNSIQQSVLGACMVKFPNVSGGSSLNTHYLNEGGTQVEVSLPGPGAFRELMQWACVNRLRVANNPKGPFLEVDKYQTMVGESARLDQVMFAANLTVPRCSPWSLEPEDVAVILRTVSILHHSVCKLGAWGDLQKRTSDLMDAFCQIATSAQHEQAWSPPGDEAPSELMSVDDIVSALQEVAPKLAAINVA